MGFKDDSELNLTSDNVRMNSLVGTEEYLAPEILSDMGELSYSADYWSLGIILYQILCGSTPFKGRSDLETYHNIQKCHEINFTNPKIDPKAKDLIQ
jgi:serine/threonine protein kinase